MQYVNRVLAPVTSALGAVNLGGKIAKMVKGSTTNTQTVRGDTGEVFTTRSY